MSADFTLQLKPEHDVHTNVIFLQVADVQSTSACVWAWHPVEQALDAYWTCNGFDWQPLPLPVPSSATGWTTQSVITTLPSDSCIKVKVNCAYPSAAACIEFYTPPLLENTRSIRFGWGGDVCGQGYGRHATLGMPIFNVLSEKKFDFFILNGDLIYADHSLSQVRLDPRGVFADWPNALDHPWAEAAGLKPHHGVAQSLDAFRAKYLYLWADAGFRRFMASTPMIYVLDDHEVRNNWTRETVLPDQASDSPGEVAIDFDSLRDSALQAWNEFAPSSLSPDQRVAPGYKVIRHSSWLDIFILDARSQRAANSTNCQPLYGPASHWLGPAQLHALTQDMLASKAVWKLLVSGTPLSTLITDGNTQATSTAEAGRVWDGVANGDHGAPSGREVELAMLLSCLHDAEVKNMVVISGDVHFASAVHHDPERAAFVNFSPFWEFINGPLHSGGFTAKGVDRSFGARQEFVHAAAVDATPPGAGCSSFGSAEINTVDGVLTVSLCDESGVAIFTQTLAPLNF